MNQTILQGFHWYTEGNGVFYKHMKEISDLRYQGRIHRCLQDSTEQGCFGDGRCGAQSQGWW